MSPHDAKSVIRRFVKEVLNDKNLAVIDEICPPDYVELDPLPGQGPGAAGLKAFLGESFFKAFPDLVWVNEEMVAEGEYVMARSTWTGTHRGEFLGIPPTHRAVKVAAWTIDHVVDGKFVDSRILVDALSLLQQLGALPAWPPPPKTFQAMVDAAYRSVPTIKAADLHRRLKREPDLLIIDVRDAAEVAQTGAIPGAINLSYGTLTYAADHTAPEDWRDPRLADHARPIVTTCGLGPLGALGGGLLHEMGFTNVQILEGGVQAWIDAGLPVVKSGDQ
jgi:rhodanese-related sulfurtransferase/predicted ester cyclase